MRSPKNEPDESASWLPWSDRLRWLNAYVFILCGAVMVYRTFHAPAAWLGTVTGVGFLAFGVYRLRLIRRLLSGELRPPLAGGKGITGPRP